MRLFKSLFKKDTKNVKEVNKRSLNPQQDRELKRGIYRDKWVRSSYPRKIELLKRINNNSNKLSQLPLKQFTRDLGEFSTIRRWTYTFMDIGYIKQLDRTKQSYEYILTDKGKRYMEDGLNSETYLKAKEDKVWELNKY